MRVERKEFKLLKDSGYEFDDPQEIVDLFEEKLSTYCGSKYAVVLDNCTDALFLCLKYLKQSSYVELPKQTFISLPSLSIQSNHSIKFKDVEWNGYYQIKPYNLYDCAHYLKKDMYIEDSYMCMSFHYNKPLKMTKGGVVLLNDKDTYDWLRTIRYSGRNLSSGVWYKDDTPTMLGYNMYMPPEHAADGILLFDELIKENNTNIKTGSYKDYWDLSKLDIYKKHII